MPNSHIHPDKNKNQQQAKNQRMSEPDARRQQEKAAIEDAKAGDMHRDIPEQRADWEGMAPQSSQVTASHPESSEEEVPEHDQEDSQSAVEGEGSYSGTRQYNQGLKKSIAAGKTEVGAKAAKKAVDGPEGEALRQAERSAKSGPAKRPS